MEANQPYTITSERMEDLAEKAGLKRTDVRCMNDEELESLIVAGLRKIGVRFDVEPEGTFYAWGDLSALRESINSGMAFFKAALNKKVITVPGTFFDVDPGQRRSGRPSRFRHHTRFSFGPSADVIERALSRMGEVVAEASR